ncbi:MAG: calcium-binding protein [Microcoleaceae cyanobacterium]
MVTYVGTPGNDFYVGTPSADQIFGVGGNDALDGSGGNDTINGNQGADRVFGNFGSDVLYGGQNNDTVAGGNQNDRLFGDNGNDILDGGNGIDTITGGSGADLFVVNFNQGPDVNRNFNSAEGDFFSFQSSRTGYNSNFMNTSDTKETPLILEFKQEGEDLLIGISESEDYLVRLVGLGDEINNPSELLDSIYFSYSEPDSYLFDSSSIEEADTYVDHSYMTAEESEILNQQLLDQLDLSIDPLDPLYSLRVSEATLIQGIEQLEAGGSLADLGWLGEGEATADDLRGALADVQGYITDELTLQEAAAAEADRLLLPEMPLVEKQIFFVEEGTTIPTEFQNEMMGSEVLTLPEGFFTPVDLESLF